MRIYGEVFRRYRISINSTNLITDRSKQATGDSCLLLGSIIRLELLFQLLVLQFRVL